jgi:hypothetical protein
VNTLSGFIDLNEKQVLLLFVGLVTSKLIFFKLLSIHVLTSTIMSIRCIAKTKIQTEKPQNITRLLIRIVYKLSLTQSQFSTGVPQKAVGVPPISKFE